MFLKYEERENDKAKLVKGLHSGKLSKVVV